MRAHRLRGGGTCDASHLPGVDESIDLQHVFSSTNYYLKGVDESIDQQM